jgi:phenylalanyl-tRNA synthetase beta chain
MDLDHLVIEPTQRPGMHPGRCANVIVRGKAIGYAGEVLPSVAETFGIDQRVAVIEVSLESILSPPDTRIVSVPSTYPHSDFDLSFVLPEGAKAADIVSATRQAGAGLVEYARIFDEFSRTGGDRRAIAIRYRLRAPDRTLTGEEVAEVRTVMIAAGEGLGARLRGAE